MGCPPSDFDNLLCRIVDGKSSREEWISSCLCDDPCLRLKMGYLLQAVCLHAKKTNKSRQWNGLRRRLTGRVYASDCSYRHQVAALFESVVLGVALRQWGDGVELWPHKPDSSKRCDLLVCSGDIKVYAEVKCMWRGSADLHGARAGMPINDEVERLVSTACEAARQLPSHESTVCFVLNRHLRYPGAYPDEPEAKREIYRRVIRKLQHDEDQAVDVLAVCQGWDAPDWCVVAGDVPHLVEVKAAFDTHWPSAGGMS